MAKERRLDVSKPGPLASRPVSVRRNRAAPMTRMREKATWRVTIILRRRTPPKPVPPRSRSELTTLSPPAWRAGARPLKQAGGYAGEEGEGEQAKAEGVAQGVGGELVRQERDEPADRKRSHGHAEDTACHRKQQAIGEELAADTASRSAEREAGADLAAARRAAGEEEAGDVQAGEAEQNAGGGEQEPQRLG